MELRIFSAGVAAIAAIDTVSKWNAAHPDFPALLNIGGSVDLIRRVAGGEICDLLILADNTIIESMLMPVHADGYCVFAGNRMVLRASEGHAAQDQYADWKEKLLLPSAVFSHSNPFADPGGYRALMTMMLADQYEEGLSARLFNHPGYIGMRRGFDTQNKPPDYVFYYYTGALAEGVPFALLPAIMDLSDEKLVDIYAKVSFAIDENTTVAGTPICHAMTIPLNAHYPRQAGEFADLFLQYGFAEKGFLYRNKKVGSWH
ncbi:MAG: substrate-binding domain-containing protein [Eubacteriaceae bacterium]|nr:substrate-binding domain-containing protein [Eubacteriaceae bacterium]